MQTVLIVIHLMIVLALVGVVLIQRSEGGGLGIGGGSGFMSARGAANALTRTTAILAALFFLTSLGLGLIARYQSRPIDILDKLPANSNILDSLGGKKTEEKKEEVPAANQNDIPTGGDNTEEVKPEAKPADASKTEVKPADSTATDAKPATTTTTDQKPATEQKPATAQ